MNSGLYALAGDSATATAAAWANRLDEPMTNVSNVYFGLSRLPPLSASGAPLRRSSPGAGPLTAGRAAGLGLLGERRCRRRGPASDAVPECPVRSAVRPARVGRRGRPGGRAVAGGRRLARRRCVAGCCRAAEPRVRRAAAGGGGGTAGCWYCGSLVVRSAAGLRLPVSRRESARPSWPAAPSDRAADGAGSGRRVLGRPDGDRDLDRSAQPPGERLGDRRAQPGLDHVPGEGVRHGEQRGVLDDRPQPGQPEVRPLLRGDDLVGELVGRRVHTAARSVVRPPSRHPLASAPESPSRPGFRPSRPPRPRVVHTCVSPSHGRPDRIVHRLSTACVSTWLWSPAVTGGRFCQAGCGAGFTVPNDPTSGLRKRPLLARCAGHVAVLTAIGHANSVVHTTQPLPPRSACRHSRKRSSAGR